MLEALFLATWLSELVASGTVWVSFRPYLSVLYEICRKTQRGKLHSSGWNFSFFFFTWPEAAKTEFEISLFPASFTVMKDPRNSCIHKVENKVCFQWSDESSFVTENGKVFFLKQFSSTSGKLAGIALLWVLLHLSSSEQRLLHNVFLSPIGPDW